MIDCGIKRMKDEKDKQTVDMFGERRKPGRQPIYADSAEKQRAYRRRLKAAGRKVKSATEPAWDKLRTATVETCQTLTGSITVRCYHSNGNLQLQAHVLDEAAADWLKQAWLNR